MSFSTLKKIVLAIPAVLFLLMGLLFLHHYYERLNMPYNEMGRYWDGQVVWLEKNVPVVGFTAGFFLLLSAAFGYLSWRYKVEFGMTTPTC